MYPAIGLAGGACGGYGLLLDIKDVQNPKRIGAVADSNFSYWHSATFNNDGTKILFSDEWGGGGQPKCRTTDKPEWGADAIFTLVDGKMVFQSYYKMPAAQTQVRELRGPQRLADPDPGPRRDGAGVVPGRHLGVRLDRPEAPEGDRASSTAARWIPPRWATAARGRSTGTTATCISSEIGRGLDIFELTPSAFISQNEIDAAKSVHLDYFNAQDQPKIVWPPSYALSGAYLDQLARSGGLSSSKVEEAQKALASSKLLVGEAQKDALLKLAKSLEAEAAGAKDPAKVRTLVSSVKDLAAQN